MSSTTVVSRSITLAAFILCLVGTLSPTPPTVHATSPCANTSGSLGGPGIGPEPEIAGSVREADGDPIEGATVMLYRCVTGEGVFVTSATTTGTGTFGFDLTTAGFYYVQVAMSGPLAGKASANGTANPSAAVAVGDGDLGMNFDFQ